MPTTPAIRAAERCIASLRRGGCVSTTDLVILCQGVGESSEMLCRRVKTGWFPTGDLGSVIAQLEDYIDDRRMEMAR